MTSLRTQLTSVLLAGGACLMAATGAGLDWQIARALRAEADTALRTAAQSLASLTEQKHGEAALEFAGEYMPQFERSGGAEIFLLRTAEGREIERSRSLGPDTLPMIAGTPEAPVFFDATLSDGRKFRCAGISFLPQDEDEHDHLAPASKARAVLVAGRDSAPLEHTLRAIRASLMAVGGCTLAALAALVPWSVQRGLRPLTRLRREVATVHAGSLATRFSVEPLPAELQPIASGLNDLLARLEGAFLREQRFTATAAHELRTPLAELRALAEVNLTTPATAAEQAESWRDALQATLRMQTLAARLLDLARVEDPNLALDQAEIDLSAAVSETWQAQSVRAAQRAVTLQAQLPAGLTIRGDATLLRVVLANLFENAVEHAPAGTPLRVQAARQAGFVMLSLRNRTDGLRPADAPHLFERFWRRDPARTSGHHHGLGLSVALEFAHLQGGTLTAQVEEGSEIEVLLRLPAGDREGRVSIHA